MKKAAFIIYRDWAYKIAENIIAFQKQRPGFEVSVLITIDDAEFKVGDQFGNTKVYKVEGKDNDKIYQILKENNIDVAFYYGWSWIVKGPILSEFICLCLHPSPLPKYRGGSPIQNQVIAGEKMSAVSVFKMSEGMDDGDIYYQIPISFEGELKDILGRMIEVGTVITKKFICDLDNNEVVFHPQQNLEENPPLKRRKKEESEISFKDLEGMSYDAFNNMVRALADPYPNAFVVLSGKKVLIKECQKYTENKNEFMVISDDKDEPPYESAFYFKLADSYALVTNYVLE